MEDYFWCCEYSISFRDQLPSYTSVLGSKITITYDKEFVLFVSDSLYRMLTARISRESTTQSTRMPTSLQHIRLS